MAEPRRVKLGRYEVIGDLAVGGMAEILLARLVGPSGFERLVVIKRIFPHLAKDPDFVAMFLDEARTVARIHHPNVVQVHELAEESAGDLFLAMEYLEGESASGLLRRLWSRQELLDPMLAAHIVAEACRGLGAAHDLCDDDGIPLDLVHRDVSPQNLFITYAGAVKVLDFGIAKLANRSTKTEPGQIKGKYAYMSPEQCAGKHLDRRSDIFSLGIVLHELCTGRRLFARDNEMATLRAVCEAPIARPSQTAPVPHAIEEACMRALSRRRDERYASCAEMRRDLLSALRKDAAPDDLEAALASRMSSLYPDRIEEKRELIRRARLGHALDHAPPAEADQNVELPPVDAPTLVELGTLATAALPERKRARPSNGVVVVAAAAAATALAAGFWRYATHSEQAAVGAPAVEAIAATAPPMLASATSSAATAPPSATATSLTTAIASEKPVTKPTATARQGRSAPSASAPAPTSSSKRARPEML